jgi:hypothetical protein
VVLVHPDGSQDVVIPMGSTVRVKLWLASEPKPLAAVIVIG